MCVYICMYRDIDHRYVCMYVRMYVCVCTRVYIRTYIYKDLYLPTDLSICLSIDVSMYRSIDPSILRSIDLSICMSCVCVCHIPCRYGGGRDRVRFRAGKREQDKRRRMAAGHRHEIGQLCQSVNLLAQALVNTSGGARRRR